MDRDKEKQKYLQFTLSCLPLAVAGRLAGARAWFLSSDFKIRKVDCGQARNLEGECQTTLLAISSGPDADDLHDELLCVSQDVLVTWLEKSEMQAH